MQIKELYKLYSKHFLVDTDTRKIRQNSIFFALKGDNFNGNKFAEKALENGAIFSIVDEEEYATNQNIILVENVLETLQQLAKYHREKLAIPVIGLTGSNGKTTTKELIYAVLSKKYKTTATIGNLNNHIGVPLTLLSTTPDTEIAIIEMGANHPKEIAFLSNIAQPDYGYITNFGKAHLEGFGSIEGVIEAKSELYDFLQKNDRLAFVNPNDNKQIERTQRSKRVLFDETISFVKVNPFVKLCYNDITITSNLIGEYNYNNIAAAITIGKYFNVKQADIKLAIENYIPTNNRSQIIKTTTNQVILDAYNANPSSMKAALDNFNLINSKNKTIILGDMFELGDSSKSEHQSIVNLALEYNFSNVILVGEHFYTTNTNFLKFKSFTSLKQHLQTNPIKHSYILIKGSRGMALERSLELLD